MFHLFKNRFLTELVNLPNNFLYRSPVLPVYPVTDSFSIRPSLPTFHNRDGGENQFSGGRVHALVLPQGELRLGCYAGGYSGKGLDVALCGGDGG